MFDSKPWILGIGSSHNGAACLLHGDDIVVAIQEERLLRCKRAEHPAAFPSLAIAYCLQHAAITAAQLDAVVVCAAGPIKREREDVYLNGLLQVGRNRLKVFTIPHHLGHAVAVYMLSGMFSTGVLVIDGNGSPWDELLELERAVIMPGQLDVFDRPDRTVPRENISLYTMNGGVVMPLEKYIASYVKNPPKLEGLEEFQNFGDMYGFIAKQIFAEAPQRFVLTRAAKLTAPPPYARPVIPVEDFYRLRTRGLGF